MRTALPLVVFLFVGCGGPKHISGLVTAKQHKSESTYLVMMPMTTSDGKNVTVTMIPMWIHEPERWELTIEPYDKDGKPIQVVPIYVTEAAYDQAKLGTWFIQDQQNTDYRKADKKPKQD